MSNNDVKCSYFNCETINVIYCFDENFVGICATSLISVIENGKSDRFRFFLICNDVSNDSRLFLEKVVCNFDNCHVEFLDFPDLSTYFKSLHFDKNHLSISTFGRLFISSLLDEDIDRVIYLDCDTIVYDSIYELYTYDLCGKTIGGVDDFKSSAYRKVLGRQKKDPYINAGVLLIDLKKWRKNKVEDRLVTYINRQKGRIHFEDQGAINAVLYKEIKVLPLKFNVMSHMYDLSYREMIFFRNPCNIYAKEEVDDAKERPIIIHYTSSFLSPKRVWVEGSNHKKKNEFDYYRNKVGVKEFKPNKTFMGSFRIRLVEVVPRKVLICIARFVHETYEPIKHKVMMRIARL